MYEVLYIESYIVMVKVFLRWPPFQSVTLCFQDSNENKLPSNSYSLDVLPISETFVSKPSLKPVYCPQTVAQHCKFYNSKTEFVLSVPTTSD